MVDAHGGKIEVQSAGKDQGSTFRVFLRSVATPAPSANGSDDTRPGRGDDKMKVDGRHRHILVVDDHHDTCTGMKMMLERRGYDITVAHTADQASAKAQARNFDLLISDIGLPDRSGYDLMRELHEKQNLKGIAISGFGMENDINKARAAGFSEHLTKPINFERLEEAIQNLLDRETVAKS
jgi:CheY-like chemotaxis protein